MLLPIVIFYLVFCYYPMYGAQIAFRDFSPKLGTVGSPWVGLKHFKEFFNSVYFGRLIRNTLGINLKNLVFGFPAPILLALMLNEVRSDKFKKTVQTVSYLPHFISTVVIAGMILQFTSTDGFITQLMTLFGFPKQNMMMNPDFFQPVYVISDIWQGIGWGSIIYIAAISGISAELYEAARIDGAGGVQCFFKITLPGLSSVTFLVVTLGTIWSFQVFDLVYTMTGGGPGTSTVTLVLTTYNAAFKEYNMGYASAVAMLMFVFVLAVSGLQKLLLKGGED